MVVGYVESLCECKADTLSLKICLCLRIEEKATKGLRGP